MQKVTVHHFLQKPTDISHRHHHFDCAVMATQYAHEQSFLLLLLSKTLKALCEGQVIPHKHDK